MLLSVVIPVYNEEGNLGQLYSRLTSVLNSMDLGYEIIFIDDGSTDESLEIIEELERSDPHVRLIAFSRNFGHQAAITAGMDHAKGQACIMLDADLQHPPELIPELVAKWRQGYDVVYTVRSATKKINYSKRAGSAIFYWLLGKVGKIDLSKNSADFRLLDRKVLDEMSKLREKSRFVRGLVSWVGFDQASIEYSAPARVSGQSKYSFRKMVRFAVDGIVSFSSFPLYLAAYLGVLVSGLAFIYGVYVLYMGLFTGRAISGWSSIMLVVLLFGGVQLISLGIIGTYLSRLYDESKKRPIYIVKTRKGVKNEHDELRQQEDVLR